MENKKKERAYKLLCLGLVGIICIMLTGAGHEDNEVAEVMAYDTEYRENTEVVEDIHIGLEEIAAETCVLRINFDLKDSSNRTLSVIRNFNGDRALLGKKEDMPVICTVQNEDAGIFFPELKFSAYSWMDEEKSIGILSLILSEESIRQIGQIQDTVLYEQIGETMGTLNLDGRESVKNIEIAARYLFKAEDLPPIIAQGGGEEIKLTRKIAVILPEAD